MPVLPTQRYFITLIVFLAMLFGCFRVVEEYEAIIWNKTDKAKYVAVHWIDKDKLVFNGMVKAHGMVTLYIEPGCYRCIAMDLQSGGYNLSEICWTKEEFDGALEEGKIPQFVFSPMGVEPSSTKLII